MTRNAPRTQKPDANRPPRRDPADYQGISAHLAAALDHAADPEARYHIREEMQRCVFEATGAIDP